MTDNMMINRALQLATEAHMGQVRNNGDPYITHPLRVGERVSGYGAVVMAAAFLHDVVEDTDITLAHLSRAGFPTEVVAAVEALTRREGESYLRFILRVRANDIARVIKLADLEDNMSDLQSGARLTKYRRAVNLLVH